jgi:hypothetical protein
VSPGFDPSSVLTFRISGTYAEMADYAGLLARIERRLDELRALPGVENAATSSMLPGLPVGYESTFALVGGRPESEPPMIGESRPVSPSYFATMKIPVVSGELCRRHPLGGMDMMVNSSFARRYLSGSSAIGHELAGPSFLALRGSSGLSAMRESGASTATRLRPSTCVSARRTRRRLSWFGSAARPRPSSNRCEGRSKSWSRAGPCMTFKHWSSGSATRSPRIAFGCRSSCSLPSRRSRSPASDSTGRSAIRRAFAGARSGCGWRSARCGASS